MTDTIHTVTLTPQEQAAFESGRKIGWNEGIEAAAKASDAEVSRLLAIWNPTYNDMPRRISYAIRALSMPAPAQAWRDISTAPRDGTRVLLWRGQPPIGMWAEMVVAEYHDDMWRWPDDDTPTTHGEWTEDALWDGYQCNEFTHWMPLPATPAALIPASEDDGA